MTVGALCGGLNCILPSYSGYQRGLWQRCIP